MDVDAAVTVRQADQSVLGTPDEPVYDRILVSAQARALPDPLVDQLAIGGRLVAPVQGAMTLIRRVDVTHADISEHGHYSFVPLHLDPLTPNCRLTRALPRRSRPVDPEREPGES